MDKGWGTGQNIFQAYLTTRPKKQLWEGAVVIIKK